jgi:flavin-dependent dehydrogenase
MERPEDLQVAPNYRMAVARSFVPGAVLLGDANGCMHPMTAGGMTNGLSDVRHLVPAAHAYLEAGGRDDAPLARYDRDRRPFFETRALLARALYEVFRSEDRGARALRDGVFRAWETSPDFRSQTLSLLGGDATSPTAFAQQYIRVVARAMGRTVRLGQGDGRLRTLLDIGRQSVVHLDPGVLSRMVSPARLLRTAA